MIEGSVKSNLAANVAAFTKAAYQTVLAGINKKTAAIQIEAKIGAGDPYKLIEGVTDIYTQEEKTINHKPG